MRLARRLALPAALCALLAAVALLPAGAGASETCTTLVGGHQTERPTAGGLLGADAPLSGTTCAAAVLSLSPLPVLPGATVTLDGSQSVGGDTGSGIAHYQWDYGDGSSIELTDPPVAAVTHPYARGPHTATLTILDNLNAVLDATSVPFVADTPPVAALGAPGGTLRPGVLYDFDASGTNHDPDPAASIVRYDWDWGDGTPPQPNGGPALQHRFAAEGTFEITVTAYDDLGVSDTATADVTVANVLPLVQLIATPSTVQVGQQLTLDASGSSDPDGSVVRYCWDLNATNAYATCTGLTASVTAGPYPNPGLLTLRVKVYDDSGGTSVKGVNVTIASPPASGGGSGSGTGGGSGSGGAGSGGSGSGGATGSGGSDASGGGGGSGGTSTGDPFAVGLSGAAIQQLKAALRHGIGLQAVANRAASGRLALTVTARDAKQLRLPGRKGARPVTIGTLRLSLAAGRTAKPAIKLTAAAARALRRAKPRTLRVTIRGSLAAGGATAAVVRVVLLRG